MVGFTGLMGGMTKEFYTDSAGTAIVEHAGTMKANVYVSGKICGSFHAPGETVVFL